MAPLSDLVARYLRSRAIGTALNMVLMRRLTKDVLEQGARDLGFLRKGVLVFSSEDESAILMDYCIYNVLRQGRNAIQRFLAESPPADSSEQWRHLQAMTRAWYSLFAVREVRRDVGVRVQDLLRQSEHLIIDMGLSRSAVAGSLFASRLIPLDGFVITGGAGLPLGGSLARAEMLSAKLLKVLFANNIKSFDSLTPDQEKELTRTIISTALSWGASSQVRYQDPDEDNAEDSSQDQRLVPVRVGGRVGRNDPCPCGSGKKFKKCCG